MDQNLIDLKREHQASISRPPYKYSLAARFFFLSMDFVAGRKTTLSKIKLLEILASIPYREWEIFNYGRMTRYYQDLVLNKRARQIVSWSREAQDNEYMHLLVVAEKMKVDKIPDAWYLIPPIPWLVVWGYVVFARLLATISLQRATLFNAEFEDHAEHSYAQFVAEQPVLDTQLVDSAIVSEYGEFKTWADVFRRIGLDERDHRNWSFMLSGKIEHVVRYEGMPELEAPISVY
jgi:hypothetical protein